MALPRLEVCLSLQLLLGQDSHTEQPSACCYRDTDWEFKVQGCPSPWDLFVPRKDLNFNQFKVGPAQGHRSPGSPIPRQAFWKILWTTLQARLLVQLWRDGGLLNAPLEH